MSSISHFHLKQRGWRRFSLNLCCLWPALHTWEIKRIGERTMSQISIPRIITNRQLNFTLKPVDTYNPKKMPYSLQDYEIDGTWNHHQSIILDCILDRIFRVVYKQYKELPRSWRSDKVVEITNGYSNGMITPETLLFLDRSLYDGFIEKKGEDLFGKIKKDYRGSIENCNSNGNTNFKAYLKTWHNGVLSEYRQFCANIIEAHRSFYNDFPIKSSVKDFLEHYPILKSYKYTLLEQLKKIAAAKFKMNYKVKFMTRQPGYNHNNKKYDRGELIDMHYPMIGFQHIFEVNEEDDYFTLIFNTPLGKLILYNTVIMDTDWIPEDALNLSKNAYFLYKRFVLSKRAGRFKANKITLKFEDLKMFLDLKWSNNRGVHAIIEKALNDMYQKDLIDSYEWNRNINNQRVYELHFKEKKREQNKQENKEGKLLKMVAYK